MKYLNYSLLGLAVASFLYGLVVMLPEKIKLARKYGPNTTNVDLIQLAKQGNADVTAYYRKSKIFGIVFGGSVMCLVLINQFVKD